MSDLATTREALIAELLGDVARLLDQIAELAPTLDTARDQLLAAARDLGKVSPRVTASVVAVADQARRQAVEHVVAQANRSSQRLAEEQATLLRQTCRAILAEELMPSLAPLMTALHRVAAAGGQPGDARWKRLAAASLPAAASAAASAAVSVGIVMHLMGRC